MSIYPIYKDQKSVLILSIEGEQVMIPYKGQSIKGILKSEEIPEKLKSKDPIVCNNEVTFEDPDTKILYFQEKKLLKMSTWEEIYSLFEGINQDVVQRYVNWRYKSLAQRCFYNEKRKDPSFDIDRVKKILDFQKSSLVKTKENIK